RAAARRLREGAAADEGGRAAAVAALVRDAGGGARVPRRARTDAACGGRAARGDGDPVPAERALRGVRGGARRSGDPLPGARRRVPVPPGCEAVAAGARERRLARG